MAMSAPKVYSEMALEVMDIVAYLWPVSLAVTSAAALALIIGSPLRDPKFRSRLPFLLTSYAIPLLVLLVGTIFRYSGPPHSNWQSPPDWYGIPLGVVLIAHAALLVATPIIMKGARLRSLAILMPSVWLTLSSWFVAGVVIAGVGP
jgi:hypothetical protein